jgi:hypothetical protein
MGAPRKAEHRTGASAAFARAVAASLPGVEASEDRGETTFEVEGEGFLCVEDDGDRAIVWCATEAEERLALLGVGRDELRARIERAWESYAPRALATSYRRKRARWSKQPAVTCDDIRRVILALPGANEGPIWGQDLGFRVGDEKRTRFARFGPPEGSKVGNLLPPDDENALVIFHCETKPELLASCAERFFTTPHYGDPGEPGGIITRLAENRGKDDLAELAKLLEAAWRRVAGPEHLAKRDRKKPDARRKRRGL